MRTEPETCRDCGARLDAATEAFGDDVRPRPGDVSVCLACGSLSLFDGGLRRRPPTGDELDELLRDQRLLDVMRARARAVG